TVSLPNEVAEAVANSGVGTSIDVVGHVDAGMMPRLYQASDVVVSVPSSDSSPATAWEALACGRPLVVSDLPWARDELRHGETAWLTPIDDGAVADALASILRDQRLAGGLGARGPVLAATGGGPRGEVGGLDRRSRRV